MKNLTEIENSRISRPGELGYDFYCFHYIHQNPLMAGLVNNLEDWEFSSYPDFIGKRMEPWSTKSRHWKFLIAQLMK